MTLKSVALFIFIAYLIGFIAHAWYLKKTVYGDGVFYYSWIRSIVVDHDIHFANEYAHEKVHQPNTTLGTPGNKYSIGPALFWAPIYTITHIILRGNGWEFLYQIAVGSVSVLSAISGLILLSYLIVQSSRVLSLTIVLIAGSTNLLFYGSIDPVNSHALTFFYATIFLICITQKKPPWFATGITLALLSSVRLQDLVYIIAIIPLWKTIRWYQFLSGFILAFLPQLTAWYALYHTLTNPYIAGGESFAFFRPNIIGVLFGIQNGLILWTPIIAVGIFGLCTNLKKYWIYLLIFSIQVYLVSSWSTWWQGASISGRMFVSSLPIIAIGLSEVIAKIYEHRLLRTIVPTLIAGLSILNALGIIYILVIS